MRLIGKCLDLMKYYGSVRREWILATRKTSSQLNDRLMPNLGARTDWEEVDSIRVAPYYAINTAKFQQILETFQT